MNESEALGIERAVADQVHRAMCKRRSGREYRGRAIVVYLGRKEVYACSVLNGRYYARDIENPKFMGWAAVSVMKDSYIGVHFV